MILPQQLYNINFYKSQSFCGSHKGMHYRIEKAEETMEISPDTQSADHNAETRQGTKAVFRVAVWPGPYNFASTPSDQIEFYSFPFAGESLPEICDFLNQKWEAEYSRP